MAWRDSRSVQTFGVRGAPGGQSALHQVIDAKTGAFIVPRYHGHPVMDPYARWGASGLPRPRARAELVQVDSGVIPTHPWLRGLVSVDANFTSEPPEDCCGHGTLGAVHLVSISLVPIQIRSVKVVEADGWGSPTALIQGLEWAADYQRRNPDIRVTVGAALGVYGMRRRFLSACRGGDCAVCRAALEVVRAGAVVSAAAGNTPGLTACPARAGLEGGTGIIAVASGDPTSGIGRVKARVELDGDPVPVHEADARFDRPAERRAADDAALRALSAADGRGDAEAAYWIGRIHARHGSTRAGLDAWIRADQRGSANAAHALGRVALSVHHLDTAESFLRRARDRGIPAAALGLGYALERQGRLADALNAYEAAVAAGCRGAAARRDRLAAGAATPQRRFRLFRRPCAKGADG